MAEIRFWQEQDLPFLRWFAAAGAWEHLPPRDKEHASIATVVEAAESNLLHTLDSEEGTAVVAVEAGQPAGYLLISVLTDEQTGQRKGYMADIYIEPAFRSQGIAGQLHQASEQYLTGLGIRMATLWIHADNTLGQKSAKRRGYTLWGMVLSKPLLALSHAQAGHQG